ncbi:UDP-N-acetylmuramoyl-L-alanine--D-glutamate ligase [Desulfocurvibacter africanus]|uniref:UDP-N-acetylmuramoylalanine--D-glutamate ligase n=1 Tax=Desulfocurvibacter africanus subsp. africanus str. Walvis Bay TaxID=690850 RepID=F3YWX2_DESAF|nr:UDP-N-acetylmuramoyl-L-alanine--D-glutamate ligase [Desulfocurvibacter africanus]EGJ51696.1 UDP-N-acetylmuramoylalanine--D-glutamate ligase [Desulfocurvibacter africanus subsp. africanus str. Walvis Bay]
MRELIHAGQLAGYQAVVLGAGSSGTAAATLLVSLGAKVRWLERKDPGEDVRRFAADKGIDMQIGEHTPEQFAGVDLVVVSPGVPVRKMGHLLGDMPERKVVSELELASWFVSEPILAVTGTNGKTTTVSLCGHILRESGKRVFVGGNIGTPLSEYLLGGERADILVLEVSSFQLQNCRTFKPHVGVLLNFSANHLDYHESMEEYLEAKLKLFARQTEQDLAIAPLNMKDELEARGFTKAKRVYYVPSNRFEGARLLGVHNKANMEAAWLACRAFGVSDDQARAAVMSFKPLSHRIEPVIETGGVLFVDDSKATTIDAMAAAITAFDRPVRLLAGGVWKGGDVAALVPLLKDRVKSVGLFGKAREVFEGAWQGHVPLFWEPTLEPAVKRLYAEAQPGDVILLSPATASFDLYKDYKARGDDFQRIARGLSGAGSKA